MLPHKLTNVRVNNQLQGGDGELSSKQSPFEVSSWRSPRPQPSGRLMLGPVGWEPRLSHGNKGTPCPKEAEWRLGRSTKITLAPNRLGRETSLFPITSHSSTREAKAKKPSVLSGCRLSTPLTVRLGRFLCEFLGMWSSDVATLPCTLSRGSCGQCGFHIDFNVSSPLIKVAQPISSSTPVPKPQARL